MGVERLSNPDDAADKGEQRHPEPRGQTDPPTMLDKPSRADSRAGAAAANNTGQRIEDNPISGADAPAVRDDFGPVDVERLSSVPLAEDRPLRVYELLGSDKPVAASDGHAIGDAHAGVEGILQGPEGRELSLNEVREALPYLNPTGGTSNCLECSMAVDDILRGRAAVAGPTSFQPVENCDRALAARTVESVKDTTPQEIEKKLTDAGPGARGIVIGDRVVDGQIRGGHVYNVANIDSEVYYIDGQNGLVSDTHPYDRQFNSFEFWRTA
jgi:papain fold toxin 1 (glutamine deamidase) of polymorphic toxin system